ncbi:MAG: DMT family transporter [Halioglobus sp.]|nr:DMT family transporter [Halioglobus sp.]
MARNWQLGLAFALVTALMWGVLPLAMTLILGRMDPVTITWYRFSLSALIALLWYGWRSGPALGRLLRGEHRGWALLAVFGLTGNYLLYISGLQFLTPGAAQIIVQFAPLLLLLASVALLGERFYRVQWLGIGLFSGGLLLFFHQRLGNSVVTDAGYLTGLALMIGAAVVWTVYGLAQKQLLVAHHAKDILLLICLGGSALLLPFAEPAQVLALTTRETLLLVFCGLNTIVAYGCFGLAMSYWDASRVSAVIPLTPLFTLLFTWALNHAFDAGIAAEPLDWLATAGALLVVAGSACVTRSN